MKQTVQVSPLHIGAFDGSKRSPHFSLVTSERATTKASFRLLAAGVRLLKKGVAENRSTWLGPGTATMDGLHRPR